MRFTDIRIEGVRSIVDTGVLPLGSVTVLVGRNKSGKSTVIRALAAFQEGLVDPNRLLRMRANTFTIQASVEGWQDGNPWGIHQSPPPSFLRLRFADGRMDYNFGLNNTVNVIPANEQWATIYPFFAKRRVLSYQESLGEGAAYTVISNDSHLSARLLHLYSNPTLPEYELYRTTCREVLGFEVSTIPSPSGRLPGISLGSQPQDRISLEVMGDGVASVVPILVYLATARGKVFLIEEPENDLHPTALKALLNLILKSAEHNQFIVSTHDNIVLRQLGSHADARVYAFAFDPHEDIPTTTIDSVPPDPYSRMEVLRSLGFDASDFDLYDAWLILEESSAESFFNKYFVPWYQPGLAGRLRTLAASGVDDVEPRLVDFTRLFTYAHLEPQYASRAWVAVDGDEAGERVIERLRHRYSSWQPSHFRQWRQPAFERYYPQQFQDAATAALSNPSKVERAKAKNELRELVFAWIEENPSEAKNWFRSSAADVVSLLSEIAASL